MKQGVCFSLSFFWIILLLTANLEITYFETAFSKAYKHSTLGEAEGRPLDPVLADQHHRPAAVHCRHDPARGDPAGSHDEAWGCPLLPRHAQPDPGVPLRGSGKGLGRRSGQFSPPLSLPHPTRHGHRLENDRTRPRRRWAASLQPPDKGRWCPSSNTPNRLTWPISVRRLSDRSLCRACITCLKHVLYTHTEH